MTTPLYTYSNPKTLYKTTVLDEDTCGNYGVLILGRFSNIVKNACSFKTLEEAKSYAIQQANMQERVETITTYIYMDGPIYVYNEKSGIVRRNHKSHTLKETNDRK